MFAINKFIVEPYTGGRALTSNNQSGFALIEQRTSLKGLKTLTDTSIVSGQLTQFVPKGSTVYIKEEHFFKPGWGQTAFKTEGMEGNFFIVDFNFVEFIKPSHEEE